ncbi:hypothetical protein P7C70_g8747, partial [Phenoliferia sp. Uapishka_3]
MKLALLLQFITLILALSQQPQPQPQLEQKQLDPSLSPVESRSNSLPLPRYSHSDPPLSSTLLPSLPDSVKHFRFNSPLPSSSSSSATSLSQQHDPQPQPQPEEAGVDDLILSPLVLAVTVDGQVHALKRDTGQWMWTLHDDGGAALGGSTSGERERRKGAGAVGEQLVRAEGRRSLLINNQTTTTTTTSLDLTRQDLWNDSNSKEEEEEEDSEVYIIEPSSGGSIYLHTRSSSPSSSPTLQKLPLTIQQLVSLSPFTFPSDSSRAFIGRKETKLVGVDLKTGRLVGVFGSGVGWCEWDERRPGRDRGREECEEGIERRPEDLLYMSRSGEFEFRTCTF